MHSRRDLLWLMNEDEQVRTKHHHVRASVMLRTLQWNEIVFPAHGSAWGLVDASEERAQQERTTDADWCLSENL